MNKGGDWLSKIGLINALVRNGLFFLTEHADDAAAIDGFDIYDIEHGILSGKFAEHGPEKGNMK